MPDEVQPSLEEIRRISHRLIRYAAQFEEMASRKDLEGALTGKLLCDPLSGLMSEAVTAMYLLGKVDGLEKK